MGAMGDGTEDKKSHKKQKRGTEKLEDSATKRKEKKKDSFMTVDGTADKPAEGEESKGAHRRAKKEKGSRVDDAVAVELTTVQEIKTPENQREEKKRKRKRDAEADDAPSLQPKKKSNKTRKREETKSKEESPPVETTKPAKKNKSQKAVPKNAGLSEKPKKKRKNKTGFPDPEEGDDNISDQARKALAYAFTQFHDPGEWKFNKARQNWLVRNFWSTTAIPEKYEELVVRYLSAVRGNARENLIQTCRIVVGEADTLTKGDNTAEQKGAVGGTLTNSPSTLGPNQVNQKETKARTLLQALVSDTDL